MSVYVCTSTLQYTLLVNGKLFGVKNSKLRQLMAGKKNLSIIGWFARNNAHALKNYTFIHSPKISEKRSYSLSF
jgi:hypothetical protein